VRININNREGQICRWIIVFMFAIISSDAFSQTQPWTVINPVPNSIVSNENLFVAVVLNNGKKFDPANVRVVFDKLPLDVHVKVNDSLLSFLYMGYLTDGSHTLDIYANIPGEKGIKQISWKFHVNFMEDSLDEPIELERRKITRSKKSNWSIAGNITIDNRNEELSGSGQGLRQEPRYTRTVSLNVTPRYKQLRVPIKYYNVSNEMPYKKFYDTLQAQDYFQVGIQNNSLDAAFGDINPVMDKLLLTGVRYRGYKVKLLAEGGTMEGYYGDMSPAYEGSVKRFTNGAGELPVNLINDSESMVPGIYRRTIAAGRLEMGNIKSERFKIGFSMMKVKDDVRSIRFGAAPKDNIGAGIDIGMKLLKKTLVINMGVAATAITNDITNGAMTKKFADSTFSLDLPFNPKDQEDRLVINTSTAPINPFHFTYGAYYGTISLNKTYHSTSIEYNKIGPHFYSLGNPFLRNNYEGYGATERLMLWKRKINLSVNYRNSITNLNQTQISRMATEAYTGTLFFNYGPKIPTFMMSYMHQYRNCDNGILNSANVKDQLEFYTFSLNYFRTFFGVDHNLRILYTTTKRTDFLRPETQNVFTNYSAGLSERLFSTFTISFDGGKTLIFDSKRAKLSDINVYSGLLSYMKKSQLIHASVGLTNNTAMATLLSHQTSRMSIIARLGFKVLRTMTLDFEYGNQPFRDMTNSVNNFDEQFLYVKFDYEFGPK
jgi:hypothetical protein